MIGRAAIEAVLDISAADVAGEKQLGKERKGGGAAYHGRQRGRVYLADRAVRVEKPRLRSPGEGELAIPAYEALRRPSGLGERMLELLLAGLSTRSYGKAIGQMAETAGVSKSSVSRWRDGSKAVRWAAAAFLDAEKGYRRIMGYKDLWILKAHLDELGTPPVDGKEGCRVA